MNYENRGKLPSLQFLILIRLTISTLCLWVRSVRSVKSDFTLRSRLQNALTSQLGEKTALFHASVYVSHLQIVKQINSELNRADRFARITPARNERAPCHCRGSNNSSRLVVLVRVCICLFIRVFLFLFFCNLKPLPLKS